MHNLGRHKWRIEGQHAACIFKISQVTQHQGMAVNNARAGGPQRCLALQSRLHGLRLSRSKQAQLISTQYAIGIGLGLNGSQLGDLGRRGGHDQFTALFVGYVAFLAIGIEPFTARNAQFGFQGSLRVVNARMNHFTVARTGTCTKGISRLQEQHLPAFQCQLTCHGQAHHAGP